MTAQRSDKGCHRLWEMNIHLNKDWKLDSLSKLDLWLVGHFINTILNGSVCQWECSDDWSKRAHCLHFASVSECFYTTHGPKVRTPVCNFCFVFVCFKEGCRKARFAACTWSLHAVTSSGFHAGLWWCRHTVMHDTISHRDRNKLFRLGDFPTDH